MQVENLNNKFFIKNHEIQHNNPQKERYKKEKNLSNYPENVDTVQIENSKNCDIQKRFIKKNNNSNHLAHASLNFEINPVTGTRFSETNMPTDNLKNMYIQKKISFHDI